MLTSIHHPRRGSFRAASIGDLVIFIRPAQGVRSLSVSCWFCHHGGVLAVDRWPDDVPVPSFGPRLVCTGCGIVGADARPNWTERPSLPSLTGTQWSG